MRPCYAFTAKTATKPAVLAIDDEIGFWGVQAADFRNQLNAVDGDLTVELNTPGGDVFAALAMYNMLRGHAAKGHKVTTRCMAVAASMGSVLMLAGDSREMPKNTMVMTHNVSGGLWGTADEMRDYADTMDKVKGQLRTIYQDRLGMSEADANALLGKDNWMTAEECLEAGFATALLEDVKLTAKFDVDRAALPENVAKLFKAKAEDPVKTPEPAPEPEIKPEALTEPTAVAVLALAKTAGLEAHGTFLALNCSTVEEAKGRIDHARQVVALCGVAGKPDDAKQYITGYTPLADVRAALVAALADSDTAVDNAPKPNNGPTNGDPAKPAVVSPTDLWASHNAQKKGR